MTSISAVAESGVVASAVVLFVTLWMVGALVLFALQEIVREDLGARRGAPAMASRERCAVSKEDVERWAICLEADRQLPPGWTARDAARLLRISARRRHVLLEEDHL